MTQLTLWEGSHEKYYVTDSDIARKALAKNYCVDKLDGNTSPRTYRMIYKYQRKAIELVAKLKLKNYHTKYFCWGRKFTQIVCRSEKSCCAKNDPKVSSKLVPQVPI